LLNFYSDVLGIVVNVFERVGRAVRGLSRRRTEGSVKIESVAPVSKKSSTQSMAMVPGKSPTPLEMLLSIDPMDLSEIRP
jgi:hypothetical protein